MRTVALCSTLLSLGTVRLPAGTGTGTGRQLRNEERKQLVLRFCGTLKLTLQLVVVVPSRRLTMRGSRDSSSDTTEPAPPPQEGPSSIHEEGWAGEAAAAAAATAKASVLPQEVAENPAPDSSSNSAAPGRNDAAEPPPTPQPTTGHDESDSTPAPSLLPLPSMGCTPDSDLARVDRLIWVVTTAAMPWRTGTAVNPLLRALYLARNRPPNAVTLLVPWLCPKEEREAQQQLYGQVFDEPSQQEDWIRDYCRTRCHCPGMYKGQSECEHACSRRTVQPS